MYHDVGSTLVPTNTVVRPCGGYTQQTHNICITFVQRRTNVFDVGPTLFKCYTNVLCLLGMMQWSQRWTSTALDRHSLMTRVVGLLN